MKLRTQILLFFFLFALTPLLLAVAINLPLVLERMERFYHEAHLQNLQADFRDLDQHLASRNEMVRLLAKLPEPGMALDTAQQGIDDKLYLARARYILWMNQILKDQLDIVQIVFLDNVGHERFWLDRDKSTQEWQPTTRRPAMPSDDFFKAAMKVDYGQVVISSISLDPEAGAEDPRRFMTLRLISPISHSNSAPAIGAVMISIDVGGMARYYRNTLWVHNSGSFLKHPDPAAPTGSAFELYPGLEPIFATGKPALWEHDGQRIMWVPMFLTEHSGALWVGRPVDPSPIVEFRNALTLRVLSIVFILTVVTWLASRWLAKRAAKMSQELTEGIQHVLKNEEGFELHWKGPKEVKNLGESLSRLAAEHGRNTRNLRAHAKELEESNRYKSQFLANVSHELRTPLNSILLLSKLLSDKNNGLSLDQQKQASVIHEAGSDLQALIDNILDLSRIEARRTIFNLESIELTALLKSLVELVQPQFDAKGIDLILEVAADAPKRVISDPDKVRQILKNFLSNAVKFTSIGKVIIRLEAIEKTPSCDCELSISVEDNGIGIPADKHGQIFEAFKQADGSTNRRYGGTGLGLSISRQLAQMLGGEIELQSDEGEGSTFSLLLPLEFNRDQLAQEDIQEVPEKPDSSRKPAEPPKANLGEHQILVVDDNIQNLLTITPLLEGWGLSVTAAEDGDETLEVLDEDGLFALVLIDIMAPSTNGCDTIKRIKAQEQHQQLPVVALIAEVDAEAHAACLKAGTDDFIIKPIDPDALHMLLTRHLTEDG